MEEVYKRFAKHLDDLPAGFPATDSGVELRIFQQMFTPEEAEVAMGLQMKVAPCICRKEQKMGGNGCDKPIDNCLIFSGGAYLYEERGIGRPVTQDEALKILNEAVDAGLVIQPGNSQKSLNIAKERGKV